MNKSRSPEEPGKDAKAPKKDDRATREERLAAALRDNLKRRKQQARARKS